MNMESLIKKRAAVKGKLTRKIKTFHKCESEQVNVEVLNDLYQEITKLVDDIEKWTDQIIALNEDPNQIQEQEIYIETVELEKARVYSLLCSKRSNVGTAVGPAAKINVKVKHLEPPKFSGNVREFPTFRSDYYRLMVANCGTDAYVLRQSLSGEALNVVKGVEDDFDKMIERLDERFGDQSRIVDSILNEIKAMKPVTDSSSRTFIDLINCIECAWLDLCKLGLGKELDNVTNVCMVEKLLPVNIKREWVLKLQKFDENTPIFSELVKFLVEERKIINYMDDESRSGSRTKASVHSFSSDENKLMTNLVETVQKLQESQINLQRQISGMCNNYKGQNFVAKTEPRQKIESKVYCWIHNSHTHDMEKCNTFLNMDDYSRLETVKSYGACFICLKVGHISKECNQKIYCEKRGTDGESCSKFHHPLLHNVFKNQYGIVRENQAVNNMMSREGVLLMMSYVLCKNVSVPTLWDSGSNLSLITHRFARKLGLKGSDVSLTVTKVGNDTKPLISQMYKVPLIDENGKVWEVEACGMDEITAEVPEVDLKEVLDLLQVPNCLIKHPVGRIEMLIGSDYSVLLPQVVKTRGNLQLLRNVFGYCIRGSLKSFDSHINNVNNFNVRLNHMNYHCKVEELCITPIKRIERDFENFLSLDGVGIQCTPKCGGCKCGKCSFTGEYTIREEREMMLIKEGMTHDPVKKRFTVTYPWISDPYNLPNNYYSALARLKSTESRLSKLGLDYTKNYSDQMKDMVTRGVARRLSSKELEGYRGPVFYLPHHEIHKPDSLSTPLRIVFDSSAKFMGVSLNDCLAKGPDVISNMFGILLRFRQHDIAVIGDIKKMYNSVHISELDQNVHRFLWRDMEISREPDQYALTRVTFGDKPSGAIAILALHETTNINAEYVDTGNKIVQNSYIDDLLISCPTVNEAKKFMRETEEIIKEGGFEIKHWVVSGDNKNYGASNIIDSASEKVLGLNWDPVSDTYSFKFRLNFSKRKRGLRMSKDITQEEIELLFPNFLTRRIILSQIAMIFDPLGFLAPFSLKAKILMRELICTKGMTGEEKDRIGWDTPIARESYDQWKQLFKSMYDIELIKFGRCVKPIDAVKEPSLILFSDASTNAMGCCAYVRWELKNGSFYSKLLTAKSKLTPMKQVTIPRLELCGAVLSVRLREIITKEMDYNFDSILHITDSAIVKAQISNDSLRFNTFVAARVSEIQSKSNPREWYWTSSENNPADLTTRVCDPDKLNSNSLWQNGPSYMKLPIVDWPISQNHDIELIDTISKRIKINSNQIEKNLIIDIHRFSSYNKLIRTTARILSVLKAKSFKAMFESPCSEVIQEAEYIWIKWAQANILDNWEIRYRRLGPSIDNRGILSVGSRIATWLRCNWNRDSLALLPSNHPFTKLYITHLHDIDHSGIESTLAKLQSKYWVPSARKLIKSVKSKCVICKRVNKEIATQCMGELPAERITPAPAFFNTAVDLFGPILIKDTVKGRVHKKVYGVVFNCLVSRAVYLDLAEGYDTNSFLMTLKRFIFVHGFPKTIYSDGGSQLVAANKELRDMVKTWNKRHLLDFGTIEGMSWCFNKSAEAPWENGCSESLIRLVKRAIVLSVGSSILTYGELQTALFEIANLMNSRPIGIKPGSDINLGLYLCPNDLLLGRSSNTVPLGIWDESSNPRKSYEHIQNVSSSFWKRWQRDYFPTLLVRQKWHHVKRNICVGDIVLIQDHNTMKGDWRIAEVTVVLPSKDNLVRDVRVRYKSLNAGRAYKGGPDIFVNRSAHKIIVILPAEDRTDKGENYLP